MTIKEQIEEAKTFLNTQGGGWWKLANGKNAHVEDWVKAQGKIYLRGKLLIEVEIHSPKFTKVIRLKSIFWNLKGKEFRGNAGYDLKHAYRQSEDIPMLEV